MTLSKDYFSENMKFLKKHHPETWEKITRFTGSSPGELCLSQDGNPNIAIRKDNGQTIMLHDQNMPESELSTYCDMVPENSTGIVVFVGMGLGYTPRALIKRNAKVRHFIIVEPNIGLFIQALHALDHRHLLKDKRLLIAVGSDVNVENIMNRIWRALTLETLHILNHLPSVNLDPATYENLYNEIYKIGNTLNLSGQTTRVFAAKFLENRMHHMKAAHHQRLLEQLKDAFKGRPAIIVAGGPSLNKNIHVLPKAAGKAVIIGVDTVLPALIAHGITPNFTTAIDMQDIVLEKFVDVSAKARDTSLVCASWVSPSIPKKFPSKQVYWSFCARNIDTWLNKLLGGELVTSGASTVAHLSFTTAVMLGCSPIIFVGQDLAYTGNQDHAANTALTQKDNLNALMNSKEIIWVDGYNGIKVPTVRAWMSDKHHFEKSMSSVPHCKFINATEGGVRLEGTEEIPLDEAISLYCREPIDIPAIIEKAELEMPMADQRKIIDGFLHQQQKIVSVEKDMARVEKVAAKIHHEVKQIVHQKRHYHHFKALPQKTKQKIINLDALNLKLDKADIWKILDEVTMDGLLHSERLHHEIRRLEGDPKRYIQWLEKHIERILFINQCRQDILGGFRKQFNALLDHLEKEKSLLDENNSQTENPGIDMMPILRFYYASGEYTMLEKQIKRHFPKPESSAELSFYSGVIAAHQSRFEDSDAHFSRAVSLAPSWSDSITACRFELAEQYIKFCKKWQQKDADVSCRMLFKGLRHCPDHKTVQQMIVQKAENALSTVADSKKKNTLPEMRGKLELWCNALISNSHLIQIVGNENAASFFSYLGQILVAENNHLKALDMFAIAAELMPQHPDHHVLHADTAFMAGDFQKGIASLNKAVAINRRYAVLWENMGDNLLRTGQPQDAIAAYERCFMSMPENLTLLKKIGDCYQAAGQPEAALEAYKQYKNKAVLPVTDATVGE